MSVSATSPSASTSAQRGAPQPINRLAKATSPYLLQHAHQPVDWYEWEPAAFAKARREGKLIFLSIGCVCLAHFCPCVVAPLTLQGPEGTRAATGATSWRTSRSMTPVSLRS